jgi:VanZ family protein
MPCSSSSRRRGPTSCVTAISEDRPVYRAAWLALAWLLTAGVVVGSLLPSTAIPQVYFWDKAQHLVAYAALAFAFAGALGQARRKAIFVGLLALGAGLEAAQGLMGAGRLAEGWDLAANALGVVAGLGLAALVPGGWCRRLEGFARAREADG